jgi:DNA-binding beta-propeller fold protein YncE
MGLAITPDKSTLVVAAGDAGLRLFSRAAVMDGCRAIPIPVSLGSEASRQGSLDVAITPDGRYALVANEYGVMARDASGQDVRGNIAIVALSYDAAGMPTGGRLLNRIATGGAAIAGVALSPDGRRLYVTSEVARPGASAANGGVPTLAHGGCRQGDGPAQPFGLLSAIDVSRAKAGGAGAVVAATAAGCSPVRATVSPDGRTAWVAARGDDRVFAFSTDLLESDPAHALLGVGDIGGKAPVGLALFAGGKRMAVANSNRFGGATAKGNLALLDADPRTPKPTASVPATYFPRSISVAEDGQTLFLTDFNGGQVQVVTTD